MRDITDHGTKTNCTSILLRKNRSHQVLVVIAIVTAISSALEFDAQGPQQLRNDLYSDCLLSSHQFEFEDVESPKCASLIKSRHCQELSGFGAPFDYNATVSLHKSEWDAIQVSLSTPPASYIPYNESPEPIRIAYVIFSSSHYSELEHLINRIYSETDYFIIHVDSKSTEQFQQKVMSLVKNKGPNVVLMPAYSILWGGMGLIKATLHAMNILLGMGQWDHLINLSETCYPTLTRQELGRFLSLRRQLNFITIDRESLAVDEYYTWVECISHMYRISTHKRPTLPTVRGSQWFTFSRRFVQWLDESSYVNTMMLSLTGVPQPDEALFSSVLYSGPYRSTAVPYATRYSYKDIDADGKTITCYDPRYTSRREIFVPEGSYCGHGPGPMRLSHLKGFDTHNPSPFHVQAHYLQVTFVRKLVESDPGSLALRAHIDERLDATDGGEWVDIRKEPYHRSFGNYRQLFTRVAANFLNASGAEITIEKVSVLQRQHFVYWTALQSPRVFRVELMVGRERRSLKVTPHMQARWGNLVHCQLTGQGIPEHFESSLAITPSDTLNLFSRNMYILDPASKIYIRTYLMEALDGWDIEYVLLRKILIGEETHATNWDTRADMRRSVNRFGSEEANNVSKVAIGRFRQKISGKARALRHVDVVWGLDSEWTGEFELVTKRRSDGYVMSTQTILMYDDADDYERRVPREVLERNFHVELWANG